MLSPRFYGLFEADVLGLEIPLWEERQQEIDEDRIKQGINWDEQEFYVDPFAEEDTLPEHGQTVVTEWDDDFQGTWVDDEHLSYTTSIWKDWKPSTASPRMFVLLMEQLGSPLSSEMKEDPVQKYVFFIFM